MESLWNDYPALIIIGAVAVLLLLWLLLRPRQRVSLSDNTPLRPHMAAPDSPRHDHVRRDTTRLLPEHTDSPMLTAPVLANLPSADGAPDDLRLLKGVGPKMVALLNQQGISRFDQIAKLSPSQVEALDASLGAFRGRFGRDRIVDQAHYLARGDRDGFEQQFGKL